MYKLHKSESDILNKSYKYNLKGKNDIIDLVNDVKNRLTPIWDLRDNVAVNPFFGFKDQHFLKTINLYEQLLGCNLLPKALFFKEKYNLGQITENDIICALNETQTKDEFEGEVDFNVLIKKIDQHSPQKIYSISDYYDYKYNLNTSNEIVNTISKWLGVYFDEGQGQWKMPTQSQRLFSAWKELAIYDTSFEKTQKGFIKFLSQLPNDPVQTIHELTNKLILDLNFNDQNIKTYYLKLTTILLGWTSFVQKFEFEAVRSGADVDNLKIGGFIDLLAILLCYDSFSLDKFSEEEKKELMSFYQIKEIKNLNLEKYILLSAIEINYRNSLIKNIKTNTKQESILPIAQMVFCIDVRSENIRRHIDKLGSEIQTIGFAGFFGLPMSYKMLGATNSEQQCPVLLNPVFEIDETSDSTNEVQTVINQFQNLNFFKNLRTSINSCFTFVEAFGWTYLFKLVLTNHLKLKVNYEFSKKNHQESNTYPNLNKISIEQKVKLAFSALKNMGLTEKFGELVFFMGHKSKSENNPQASALDCGACAGHSGVSNARVLAGILNDKEVRFHLLSKYKIEIPEDTCFISGVHITTTDEFEFDEYHIQTQLHLQAFKLIQNKLNVARIDALKNRSKSLNYCKNKTENELIDELNNKSKNWSDVQPEWGLANNAAFIAARRDLTASINLDSRVFLHDYDHSKDADLSILELIMTAPVIVANWINMQYYVSAVCPTKFSSGDKTLHNIIGQIGLIRGNGSDLLMGLSRQSLFNREGSLMHDPLRLQVFIEASTLKIDQIINKHKMVRDLANNDWIKIISIDPFNGDKKRYNKSEWELI